MSLNKTSSPDVNIPREVKKLLEGLIFQVSRSNFNNTPFGEILKINDSLNELVEQLRRYDVNFANVLSIRDPEELLHLLVTDYREAFGELEEGETRDRVNRVLGEYL